MSSLRSHVNASVRRFHSMSLCSSSVTTQCRLALIPPIYAPLEKQAGACGERFGVRDIPSHWHGTDMLSHS